jgi:NAD(P)-dependent dehydrogenase (short-subunit alcohol dehydrogenase family)
MAHGSAAGGGRDRVVVITGGNSGIGREAAASLAAQGATVVIGARDPAKGSAAAEAINAHGGPGRVEARTLDLASFASVRRFAADLLAAHERLDVLVANAGAILSTRKETQDGFEATFGVNHLGHFLLTSLLRDRLVACAPARVVTVSSVAHRLAREVSTADPQFGVRRYDGTAAYNQSKLANLLFAFELARRLAGTGVTSNALHPGAVRTGFGGPDDTAGLERVLMVLATPFLVSPARGARTLTYLASSPEVEGVTGQYFVRRRLREPSRAARDPDAARRLWELSEELVASVP